MTTESPKAKASAWLASFGAALESADVATLKKLFADVCYWGDLVALTWNIKTPEGIDAIGEMAKTCLPAPHPRGFALDGEASEADGVAEGWFAFETDAARGVGHVRLKDGRAWTLLTTAQELKGFEER